MACFFCFAGEESRLSILVNSAWNDVRSSDGKSETNFEQDGSDRKRIRTTSAHYCTRDYRVSLIS